MKENQVISVLDEYVKQKIDFRETSKQVLELYNEEAPYNNKECIFWIKKHPRDKCKGCPSFLSCQKQSAVILALMNFEVVASRPQPQVLGEARQMILNLAQYIMKIMGSKTVAEITTIPSL